MFDMEDVNNPVPKIIGDWDMILEEPSSIKTMLITLADFYIVNLMLFGIVFGLGTLLLTVLTIRLYRKKKHIVASVLLICTLFSAGISAHSLFYDAIKKELIQLYENPKYEPSLLDKSTVNYPIDISESELRGDPSTSFETLSEAEWKEIRSSDLSQETILRLIRTTRLKENFNNSRPYEEYLHFYNFYAEGNITLDNMQESIQLMLAADNSDWYKNALSAYELSLHQQSLMKPPHDAEEFLTIHKVKIDIERKFYELYKKEAKISELLTAQKEGRVTEKEVQNALLEYSEYLEVELPVIEEYQETYDRLLGEITELIKNETDKFFEPAFY